MQCKWMTIAQILVDILLVLYLFLAIKEVRSLSTKLDTIQRPVQIFDCEYKYNGALS